MFAMGKQSDGLFDGALCIWLATTVVPQFSCFPDLSRHIEVGTHVVRTDGEVCISMWSAQQLIGSYLATKRFRAIIIRTNCLSILSVLLEK